MHSIESSCRVPRQIEIGANLPPFSAFGVLRDIASLPIDESNYGHAGREIDPHFYNKDNQSLTCVLPRAWWVANLDVACDVYIGAAENTRDDKLLGFLARGGAGLLVECRGPLPDRVEDK